MTEPAGTVRLDAVVTAPTMRFAPVIAVVAAACVRPTTFGTATCGGPDDTTSATALPVATCVPATRSEERRVRKESSSRGAPETSKKMRLAPGIAVGAA